MFNSILILVAILGLFYIMYKVAKFIVNANDIAENKAKENINVSIMDEEVKPYYIQDDTKAFYAHGAKTESIKSVDTPDYVADTPVVKKKTAKKKTTKPKKTTSSKVTLPL